MACFAAPAGVAIVTTTCRKQIPNRLHVNWLNTILWAVSAGLMIEHVITGEIVSYFPFLTALSSPEDTGVMIHEILTEGIAILGACVTAWIILLALASYKTKIIPNSKKNV